MFPWGRGRLVNPTHRSSSRIYAYRAPIDNYWQISEAKVRSRKFVIRCVSSP